MSQAPKEQAFSLLYIFEVTRKYSLYIAAVTGVSALIAIILTMPFIYKPEFKASAIMYPTNSERWDVANIFAEEPSIYMYGTGKEVEKLENIANSEQLKLFVIDSMDLWDAYGVDPETDEAPKYYVFRTYDGLIQTIRVAGHGLEVEAYDTDPQRAADIVNLIINRTDHLNQQMINNNKANMLRLYDDAISELNKRMGTISDSLAVVRRKYNIVRTLAQSERMIEQIMIAQAELAEAQARGAGVAVARSKVQALTESSEGMPVNLEDFREGIDKVQNLENVLDQMAIKLGNTQEKAEYLRSMDELSFNTVMVADYAHPADKKARPVRWIIMLATLIIAAVASIFGAVLIDRITSNLEEEKDTETTGG